MENHDKIFDKIKEAAQKAESSEFPAMEKVWSRVEDKLDKKADQKNIALWKKLAIAASLLLFFSLGYQFFKSDIKTDATKAKPENNVVVAAPKDSDKTQPPVIRKDAGILLTKQIEKQQTVVSSESDSKVDPETEINPKPEVFKEEASVTSKQVASDTGTKLITGVVSDATGSLPGAHVVVKGTEVGTQTDIDGKFSIAAKKGDELVFSFVGMQDAMAVVDGKSRVDMELSDGVNLEEVVVDGYNAASKKKIAVSAATVTSETVPQRANNGTFTWADPSSKQVAQGLKTDESNDFNYYRGNLYTKDKTEFGDGDKNSTASKPNATFLQGLQGQVAGINVGAAKTQVIIRGFSSINQNADPLYVIDGVVSDAKTFRALSPEDIDSISVLKDAGATAIYGNAGSNGVIIVKTVNRSEDEEDDNRDDAKTPEKSKIEVSQEDYDSFVENAFESPKNAPLSTFSIDVDNASYTNIRRFINNGQTVPKDAVRVEEMINFFKYQYPQPQDAHPFSINTEYSDCPWNSNHKLLRIGLQGKNIPTDALPASNLVFLIDVSGSMDEDNKLPLLKQSMKVLVNEMRSQDKVAIVVYAGAAGLVLPPTSGSDKKTILKAIENLSAGGSTAGGAGIELAYKVAQENFAKNGNNRVILATDGDFNVGASSNADMQTLIEEKRKSGVFLTCLGYGMGNYKDDRMETLADKGNGNYAYIDNIQEANRFLGKEFKGSMYAIAKDVKIQIEFNPKHVQSYRLIGYENRKLRPEDFANDTVDAGELGSGHTVTALYEIIPTGIISKYFNEAPELKYTQTEKTGNDFNDELATVKFRYKKPDEDTSIEMVKVIENKSLPLNESSEDFKFSAAVAWFGLKLRNSQLITDKASENIEKLAKQGMSYDDDGYKAEFIRLVDAVK